MIKLDLKGVVCYGVELDRFGEVQLVNNLPMLALKGEATGQIKYLGQYDLKGDIEVKEAIADCFGGGRQAMACQQRRRPSLD